MFNFSLKKGSAMDVACLLLLPLLFLLLWVLGVSLMKLIIVLLFACILICSIGCILISKYNKKSFLELKFEA